jgi:hypothetical protein
MLHAWRIDSVARAPTRQESDDAQAKLLPSADRTATDNRQHTSWREENSEAWHEQPVLTLCHAGSHEF